MNIRNIKVEEDVFAIVPRGISKIYHEVFLLMKCLQTKPSVMNMITKHYDLYYTVFKNRNENEVLVDKYDNNENDYINFIDIITHNHYNGRKKMM